MSHRPPLCLCLLKLHYTVCVPVFIHLSGHPTSPPRESERFHKYLRKDLLLYEIDSEVSTRL